MCETNVLHSQCLSVVRQERKGTYTPKYTFNRSSYVNSTAIFHKHHCIQILGLSKASSHTSMDTV